MLYARAQKRAATQAQRGIRKKTATQKQADTPKGIGSLGGKSFSVLRKGYIAPSTVDAQLARSAGIYLFELAGARALEPRARAGFRHVQAHVCELASFASRKEEGLGGVVVICAGIQSNVCWAARKVEVKSACVCPELSAGESSCNLAPCVNVGLLEEVACNVDTKVSTTAGENLQHCSLQQIRPCCWAAFE